MRVREISHALGLEQTSISHKLKCLAFCDLTIFENGEKMRTYELNHETVKLTSRLVDRHISNYAENLRDRCSLEL